MMEFWKKRKVYIVSIIHFVISCIHSGAFFSPIRENVGIENVAYKWCETGVTLRNDIFSRSLCWIYSHMLAAVLIFVFWSWVFFIIHIWKAHSIKRTYIGILLSLIIIGIFIIAAIYPATITSASDTSYNYVYAKEWLPMYWHGFFTNVVHCACILTFFHPVSMSVIPFLFGINLISYFTYHTVIKYTKQRKLVKTMVWGIWLLLMPETFQLLTYAGRNYMYAILSVSVFGILLKDYLEKEKLSTKKFIVLSFLVICLAVWRSEGLLYLIFYPFFLYFTYFYKRKVFWKKKKILQGIIYIGVLYLILAFPDKYGNEKYQGYDYFIINTPGPLSAVLINEKANFSYKNADKDLDKINDIVPLEYIKKYGSNATACYNLDNLRLTRQCDAGNKGKEYVIASYRALLYNWPIYFEYQINLFGNSIGFPRVFQLTTVDFEEWNTSQNDVKEWREWLMDYYSIGEDDMSQNYDIVFFSKKFDKALSKVIYWGVSKSHEFGWRILNIFKIPITFLVIAVSIISYRKREWIYTILGVFTIAIFTVIVLTAPTIRENYYYSVYFNQYWFLLFAWFQAKKNGIRIPDIVEKREAI